MLRECFLMQTLVFYPQQFYNIFFSKCLLRLKCLDTIKLSYDNHIHIVFVCLADNCSFKISIQDYLCPNFYAYCCIFGIMKVKITNKYKKYENYWYMSQKYKIKHSPSHSTPTTRKKVKRKVKTQMIQTLYLDRS